MTIPFNDQSIVRRYMSFSRFVWMLQIKQLWLSRASMLEDRWESTLTVAQLQWVLLNHPPHVIGNSERPEDELERATRIIKYHQENTLVSCWCAAIHESHALWRIYCPKAEGVAIETTLSRLRASVAPLKVETVSYEPPQADVTPNVDAMILHKRPMFAYEEEVRVVRRDTDSATLSDVLMFEDQRGCGIAWNPAIVLTGVVVHPEADASFLGTVSSVVKVFAPSLLDCVRPSAMSEGPPIRTRE